MRRREYISEIVKIAEKLSEDSLKALQEMAVICRTNEKEKQRKKEKRYDLQ